MNTAAEVKKVVDALERLRSLRDRARGPVDAAEAELDADALAYAAHAIVRGATYYCGDCCANTLNCICPSMEAAVAQEGLAGVLERCFPSAGRRL